MATESPLVPDEAEPPTLVEPEEEVPMPGASHADVPEPTEELPEPAVESAAQPEISEEASSSPQPEVPEASPDPIEEGLLRVVDVEHCLNLRAQPHIEAEVLTCIPLGEYVSPWEGWDTAGLVGKDGITWRAVSYAESGDECGQSGGECMTGYASGRYLEGPELIWVVGPPPYVGVEEFPDAALLVQPHRRGWRILHYHGPLPETITQLDRVYRRSDGELVRETVVTLDDLRDAYPDVFSDLQRRLVEDPAESTRVRLGMKETIAATPDGDHLFVSVCSPDIVPRYRDLPIWLLACCLRVQGWRCNLESRRHC